MRIALIAIAAVVLSVVAFVAYVWFAPRPTIDEVVLVNVFPEHFVIDGQEFTGSLQSQLGRFATTDKRVSIVLSGEYETVNARAGELSVLRGNPRVSVGLVTSRLVQ
jgi:hypothetical protein